MYPTELAASVCNASSGSLDCDSPDRSLRASSRIVRRDLRERFFGDLDGKEDAPSYAKVWALDALSARHGELGVEPAAEVCTYTLCI